MYQITDTPASEIPAVELKQISHSIVERAVFLLNSRHLVDFGQAGLLYPMSGTVSRSKSQDGEFSTVIHLEAKNINRFIFEGEWGSPRATQPNPVARGFDGHGHVDELPRELRDSVLALLTGAPGVVQPATDEGSAEDPDQRAILALTSKTLIPKVKIGAVSYDVVVARSINPAGRVSLLAYRAEDGRIFPGMFGPGPNGLGDEYLIVDSRVRDSLTQLGLIEEAGYSTAAQEPLFTAQGELRKLTGEGFPD